MNCPKLTKNLENIKKDIIFNIIVGNKYQNDNITNIKFNKSYHSPKPMGVMKIHELAINNIKNGKKVLEFGCSSGIITKILLKKRCTVLGIDKNPPKENILKDFLKIDLDSDLTNLKKIKMSSTKSAIGHLLGASGSVEAIYSICAINNNQIPPTLNLNDPIEESAGIDLVPNNSIDHKISCILSNSFGFGGTNASLIIQSI